MVDYDISIPVGNTPPYRIRQALQELGMTAYNTESTIYGLTRPLSPGETAAEEHSPAGHKHTVARIEIKDRTAHLSGTSTSKKRIIPILREFESVDEVVEQKPVESWLARFLRS